jgi:GNAT superfamily N-acetyltransferase
MTPSQDTGAAADVEVLRAEDPRCRKLESRGYVVAGESWGARLRLAEPPDLARQMTLVARVRASGVTVRELGREHADALHVLEQANHADYPVTPATTHPLLDRDATRDLWTTGRRVFGALCDDRLVAATVVERDHSSAETLFTSVLSEYRGRGIGAAVKAASVLALAAEGVRTFGTGGSGANEASLAANRAVGYSVEERWRSYRRP